MAAGTSPLAPEAAPARLTELSPDLRAAVLLDAAGATVGTDGVEPERAEELAQLTRQLFEAADTAEDEGPAERVEVQVDRGAVLGLRTPRWTVAVVARRAALSSLTFMDMRAVVDALDGVRALTRVRPGRGEDE
jgi:hypothetical protein